MSTFSFLNGVFILIEPVSLLKYHKRRLPMLDKLTNCLRQGIYSFKCVFFLSYVSPLRSRYWHPAATDATGVFEKLHTWDWDEDWGYLFDSFVHFHFYLCLSVSSRFQRLQAGMLFYHKITVLWKFIMRGQEPGGPLPPSPLLQSPP